MTRRWLVQHVRIVNVPQLVRLAFQRHVLVLGSYVTDIQEIQQRVLNIAHGRLNSKNRFNFELVAEHA